MLASRLLGWSTVCAVELKPYPRKVLLQRQRDGILEPFPIWDDVCTFDGNPWRGSVDVISGGFPCQDISQAGSGKGLSGERSSLVYEMLRIAQEVQPRFIWAENSARLRANGLGAIVTTLERMGYDCAWCVLGARHVGAPHRRDRLWLLAHANSYPIRKQRKRPRRKGRTANEPGDHGIVGLVCDTNGNSQPRRPVDAQKMAKLCGDLQDADSAQRQRDGLPVGVQAQHAEFSGAGWWQTEPTLDRVVNGFPGRLDQLRAIGNGQVPQVAALAWRILSNTLGV